MKLNVRNVLLSSASTLVLCAVFYPQRMQFHEKRMMSLRDALWPFHQMFHDVDGLPEHLKESVRMRNRWRAEGLLPFILRWFAIVGFLSLCLYIADYLPDSLMSLILHMALLTAWMLALGFTAFLLVLYSMRPH